MIELDFFNVITKAWEEYDPSRQISSIVDISARVSTNHVFAVKLDNNDLIIAKCSYYGKFAHFKEDHTIINVLSNTLPPPYENFLARSLMKDNEVYTYRYKDGDFDAWAVFYYPITIQKKLPRQLTEMHIKKLGKELASFHLACEQVKSGLPAASKTLKTDIDQLKKILNTEEGRGEYGPHIDFIREQCDIFLENSTRVNYEAFSSIPVFVDWNIGNFSVTEDVTFFSRWDYDWFRVGSRVLDFYFFSRVSSTAGDRTVFSYLADPLMEDRFMIFLKEYHKIYPLTEAEVHFMKEAYRFFIINYVIKDGRYFFHQVYAKRLLREAYELYFPMLDKTFKVGKILKALKLQH